MTKTEPFTEVLAWSQRLELFSKGKSYHHTATPHKGLHWGCVMEQELQQLSGPDKPLPGDRASCGSQSPKHLFLPAERSHTEHSFWSTPLTTGLRFQRQRISNSSSPKRQEYATAVLNWGWWLFCGWLQRAAPLRERDWVYEVSWIWLNILKHCQQPFLVICLLASASRNLFPMGSNIPWQRLGNSQDLQSNVPLPHHTPQPLQSEQWHPVQQGDFSHVSKQSSNRNAQQAEGNNMGDSYSLWAQNLFYCQWQTVSGYWAFVSLTCD